MPLSLDAAISGMVTQQQNIDLIANNLANVNTTGYKRAKIHFQDSLNAAGIAAAMSGGGGSEPTATSAGVNVSGMTRDFSQGTLQPTGRQLDFAINGDGFFRIKLDDGQMAYTRNGVFLIDGAGKVTTQSGELLDPPLQLPEKFQHLAFEEDGSVTVMRPYTDAELADLGEFEPRDGKREVVGQIKTVRFLNPSGLEATGNSLYRETPESQPPIEGIPGKEGLGTVHSGWVEASNVDIATEMTGLVFAKRGFQLNLVAYKTIEEMLKQVNQVQ
ncbi:MAG: flagellar hook-basal body complex protein [Dehalococcoidia bacterium]